MIAPRNGKRPPTPHDAHALNAEGSHFEGLCELHICRFWSRFYDVNQAVGQ